MLKRILECVKLEVLVLTVEAVDVSSHLIGRAVELGNKMCSKAGGY